MIRDVIVTCASIKMCRLTYTILLILASLCACCPSPPLSDLQLASLSLDCFLERYDMKIHNGYAVARIVNERANDYKKLLQKIKMQNQEHVKAVPVVKWAQSTSHIYLSLRLSHRQDSPTCSDIHRQHFNLTDIPIIDAELSYIQLSREGDNNDSLIDFEAQCYFTHQKLMFSIHLQLQGRISNLTMRRDGLGTYTLVGEKEIKQIWIKPFVGWERASIWRQLRSKYEKDMTAFFQQIEDITSTSSKGKKRPKKRKNQESKENIENNEIQPNSQEKKASTEL